MVQGASRARRGLIPLLALAGAMLLWPPPAPASSRFRGEDVKLERKRAYDVGVTDYDRDGILDPYSTNHMFRDSLLRGDGEGGFADVYDSAGFAPNPTIPGIEEMARPPRRDDPGLYMWLQTSGRRPNIRIAAHQLAAIAGADGSAGGRIIVVFPKVRVRRQSNAEVTVNRRSRTRTVIRFELGNSGRVVLRPHHIGGLPFRVKLDEPLPATSFFLGPRAVPAPARDFTINLGDRHGVAWDDYNRDGRVDAFATSGGIAGKARLVPRLGRDELLLDDGGILRDETAGSGLRKGSCRGREAQSVDFDRDGVVDLFEGCRIGRPHLYAGNGDGTFDEVRRRFRPTGKATANRWIDLDRDGAPELVRAGQFHVRVFAVNRRGGTRLRQDVRTPNEDKNVEAIAPGDFDGDGDLDLFMAAPSGNSLLVNRGRGRLVARDPRRYGLPRRHGVAAAWVDFDNDGRLDLYVSPDGLFRNVGGRFRATGELRTPGSPRFARASWFDADGDGRRDLLRFTQRGRGLFPQIRLFRNRAAPRNHWLQLDLVGRPGNLHAIGARVEARVGRRTRTQWVGQNEGSRYGQGHYRLYFGLGRHRRARRVTVFWPGGRRTRLGTVGGDRLRTISIRSRRG